METIGIIDCETQGLDPTQHRAIEIGCVLWSVSWSCVIAAWSDLVQHETNEAESINRIPVGSLALGLAPNVVISRLRNFVARADVLVAHNAEFDASFLPQDLAKPFVCSKFDIEWPGAKLGDPLVYLALALGVPVTHTHRALSDCMILARCFEAGARLGMDINAAFARAMRPKGLFRGLQPFEHNNLAKDAGFRWNADARIWMRRMAIEDAASLPFQTVRLDAL